MVAKADAIEASRERSSSTTMPSPPWSLIAAARPAALGALRVVITTKKPSRANFWAMAPPTPHRTPTGRWLSSSALPWASLVLRPSDCHFDVAPMTTATGLPLLFFPAISSPLSSIEQSRQTLLHLVGDVECQRLDGGGRVHTARRHPDAA